MPKPYAIIVDLLLVVLFAVLGRLSHHEGIGLVGVVQTAWPFLVALLVGWAVLLWRKRDHLTPTSGVFVWLVTWVGGLVLRVVGGDTAAVAFMIVAGLMLALFLIGWRLLALLVPRGRAGR